MNYILFTKTAVIGFLLSVPVGPVNLLCIRRSILKSRAAGFISGLGAATCDAFFAYVTAFSISYINSFFVREEVWLRLGGGILLLIIGLKSYLTQPKEKVPAPGGKNLFSAYATTFLLNLSNPLIIIAFAAAFAGFGVIGPDGADFPAVVLVAGVLAGSSLWWFVLSSVASLFQKKFNHQGIWWLSRLSGFFIALFGFLILAKLV